MATPVEVHITVYQIYDNIFQCLKDIFFDDQQAFKNFKIEEVIDSLVNKNSDKIRNYFKKGYAPNFILDDDMKLIQ